MSSLGKSTATGTGDVYSYEWCFSCKTEFEIIKDELYGGEIEIREI